MAKIEEIESLVLGSGNNFHAKVARWFTDNQWHVVVSPYYMDQAQSKAREIDLVVERAFPWYSHSGFVGNVIVRLFVECKYVAAPAVFWFAKKDEISALELVEKNNSGEGQYINPEKHHYLSGNERAAKLFASSNSRGSENDPFFKALNQVLNAMVSLRGQSTSIPQLRKNHWAREIMIEYPVVVCSSFDNLYFVNFDAESAPQRIENNFLFEVRYAYVDRGGKQMNDYFLLDFIEFDRLSELAKAVEEEAYVAGGLGFRS